MPSSYVRSEWKYHGNVYIFVYRRMIEFPNKRISEKIANFANSSWGYWTQQRQWEDDRRNFSIYYHTFIVNNNIHLRYTISGGDLLMIQNSNHRLWRYRLFQTYIIIFIKRLSIPNALWVKFHRTKSDQERRIEETSHDNRFLNHPESK